MIKKVIIVLSLSVFFSTCVYSQKGAESDCDLNLENIFKANDMKIRFQAVDFLFIMREKFKLRAKLNAEEQASTYEYLFRNIVAPGECFIFAKNTSDVNDLSKKIIGFPYNSIVSDKEHGQLVDVEWMSEEEIDSFVEQMGTTPEDAVKDYLDFTRNIKEEKEIYLKCIDAELAKGDSSKYATEFIPEYDFHTSMQSIRGPVIKKTDFLKVFKEFILLNDDAEYLYLPDVVRVIAYLKCGCKI